MIQIFIYLNYLYLLLPTQGSPGSAGVDPAPLRWKSGTIDWQRWTTFSDDILIIECSAFSVQILFQIHYIKSSSMISCWSKYSSNYWEMWLIWGVLSLYSCLNSNNELNCLIRLRLSDSNFRLRESPWTYSFLASLLFLFVFHCLLHVERPKNPTNGTKKNSSL